MIRVLIVEDDPLIGLDLAEQLTDAGFAVAGIATNVSDGIKLLNINKYDIAILDINLGHETSEPIAQELVARNMPFITVSGYSETQHPPIFKNSPMFAKPVRIELLIARLRDYVPLTLSPE